MDGTIIGVLLGITMCAVAWAIKESRHHQKLIIDLQNRVIFDMGERIGHLERREKHRTIVAEGANQPKPAGVGAVRMRSWNENMPIGEDAR